MCRTTVRQVQSRLDEFVNDLRWENEEISPYGSSIGDKNENVLRTALQNIRGISNNIDNIALEEIDAMDNYGIDLLGMNEINIAMTLERRLQLASALQMRFAGSRTVSSSMKPNASGYLPGGTTTIMQGSHSGRVYRRGSDHMGRFSWMALRGVDGTGIIVITAYRVSQHKGTAAGENTAYMREWGMLRSEGIKEPDPRLMVLQAISEVLHEWGNRSYHPLVMMDANGELDDPQLRDFVDEHGLFDLIAETNEENAPRTYQRSGRRLDYIFGDEHVLAAVDKSGSLGSGDGVSFSDHTLQFVDLDCKRLFGAAKTAPYATYEREYKLKDTKKKEQFLEKLHSIYEHQSIKQRVHDLADALRQRGPTPALVQTYQILDNDITRAMRSAANYAGRKDFGYHRSDTLVNAGRTVRLTKTIASCVRNKMGYSTKVIDLAESLEFELPPFEELTFRLARKMVTKAINEKKEIQRMAAEHRALWLERLAQEAAASKPGSDWEKVLKQMITASRQKVTNKRLNAIFRPEWASLDYIEVPNEVWFMSRDGSELYEFDDGIFVAHQQIDERVFEPFGICKVLPDDSIVVEVEQTEDAIFVKEPSELNPPEPTWQTVDKPDEMQEWLMRRNKRHLNQMHAEERPPTRKEFQSILAEHGTSETAMAILNGTLDPSTIGLDKDATNFIKSLARRTEEEGLSTPRQMSTKDFQESMKVTHEDTSSSASGLHYTLWKTIAEDNKLSAIHAIMISLPFMYGFICDRWKKIIDCMLEKKPGVRKIHIMRIICLFEADFNTILKWYFNKHIMPNAEKSGLSPDQWGGRNSRSAPACAMRKVITWEYARFTKTVLTSFFADLQSNFDCILPDMSSIFLMKKGMNKEAAYARAATMSELQRGVRTATGTSTKTYQHDPGMPSLPGEGQGKADSMAIWTLISSEILSMHQTMCQGVEMVDATGKITSRRTDDAYVDDTDTYATAPKTNEVEEAVQNLTNHSQTLAILVAITGQFFAFHKCMWQILFWISVAGEYLMASNRNIKGNLWLSDSRGKRHKIKRKPATEPNPGLGFLICPTAEQKFEYEKRLKQAQDIAKRVSTNNLPPQDAWLGLKTRALPKICYPFGLTRFTTKQLKKIGSVINNAFLHKIGFNRKTPRVLLYAPAEYGGFEFPYMETIQDQKGISLFLRQLQWDKENAQDIKIVLSQAQLDSGLTEPILEDTRTNTSYIEEGLIQHLRERLDYLNGSIAIEDIWCPSLQREGDISIMKALSRLPGVTKNQLKKANMCRKWLRVITIGELASVDGKYIPSNRFNGRGRAQSNLNWPRQPIPTKEMWIIFRQLIKRAFCSKYKWTPLKSDVRLDSPLGAWYQTHRHIQYEAYRTRVKLFLHNNNNYRRFKEKENTNYFEEDGDAGVLPKAAHPTSTTRTLKNHLQATTSYESVEPPQPQNQTTEDATENDPEHIYRATNIIAASDSSVDPITGEATYNWRITTYDKKGLITKSSFVNGNPAYMNSYRGEMAGLQDLFDYIHATDLRRKVLKVVCDNKGCVDVLNQDGTTLVDLDRAEADLIQNIKKKIVDFDDVTIAWVKGHQDDDDQYENLPIESQLNIDCDAAAKLHLKEGTRLDGDAPPTAGMKATLYLGGHVVTTDLNEQILKAGNSRKMLEYAADKFGWTDNQATATVNWRAIGQAKRRLKLHSSVRTTKMMYDWLNVGSQKRKMGGDGTCPCCGLTEEDQLHLYRCTNETMQQTLSDSISNLNSKLVKEGLATPVYTAVINCICEAVQRPPLSTFEIDDDAVLQCIESQEMLGNESFLRGFHHIDWLHLLRDKWIKPKQPSDGTAKTKRKDPLQQSIMLIQSVWEIFETQWKCRNSILHSNDSELIERSRDTLTARLLEFRRESKTLLRSSDRFIIDNHSIQDVIKWPLTRKKAVVEFLEKLHKIYCGEMKTETASYRDIASYFIKLPPKDTTPSASSNDKPMDANTAQTTQDTSSSDESSYDDLQFEHQRHRRLRRRCPSDNSIESACSEWS
jgi:hypothetical protein